MESREDLACFAAGAAGYPLLELLWRGHTHWTMSCTGGVCLAAMRRVCKKLAGRSLALCCAACGGVITGAELAVGLLVNRLLGWRVWDYSRRPMNLWGQVCLGYAVLWTLLSLPICLFFRRTRT